MNKFLSIIKTVWFWSGLIFLILTSALFITLFSNKVFISKPYDNYKTTNSTTLMSVELRKDANAVIKLTNNRYVPCVYGIENNTLIIESSPEYNRANEPISLSFTIKNRFKIVSSDGNIYKVDNLPLIYIGMFMGISGIIFISSGIDSIKKSIKNKKTTQSE